MPDRRQARCALCPDIVDVALTLEHLRVMHPDQWEPPQTWPDGGLVVVDETLEPGEFT